MSIEDECRCPLLDLFSLVDVHLSVWPHALPAHSQLAVHLCWPLRVGSVMVEVVLYVHRNRRFIRDGSPGRPPLLASARRVSHPLGALLDLSPRLAWHLLALEETSHSHPPGSRHCPHSLVTQDALGWALHLPSSRHREHSMLIWTNVEFCSIAL